MKIGIFVPETMLEATDSDLHYIVSILPLPLD
jgi:hypothetical protein